jgi:hypothetical protein
MSDDQLGRIAYDAYSINISLSAAPPWEHLTNRQRDGQLLCTRCDKDAVAKELLEAVE